MAVILGFGRLALAALPALAAAGSVQAQTPAHTGHAAHTTTATAAAAPKPGAPLPPPGGPGALKATLVGSTEVPGPGDPDGNGMASVNIDLAKGQLCYTLTVLQVEGVTMAHIHRAPMGSMGNVVVPLTAPTSGSSEGCVSIRPELATAILSDPSGFYVNVHSEAHIAGAVRGQLGK